MALQGQNRQLFGRFKFVVTDSTNRIASAAYQSATGLKYNIAKIEYWEGGALAAHKEPGRVTFDDLTLERGVAWDEDHYNWLKEVVDIEAALPGGKGQISPKFKRDLVVKQLERDNSNAILYTVYGAFPIEWSASEFDNTADEVSIESVVLTYHHFTRQTVGSPQ